MATLQELEEKLDTVQKEYRQMKEHCDCLELRQICSNGIKAEQKKPTCFSEPLVEERVEEPIPSQTEHELLKCVEKLTEKLHTASYQRDKCEKALREVIAENQVLSCNLERAEVDMGELHTRLRTYEDIMEKQSLERSCSSPVFQHLSVISTPTYGGAFQYASGLPTPSSADSSEHPSSLGTLLTTDSTLGTSLFSELDSQYSDLQERYDQLLQQCTCSAGLAHRNQQKPAAAHRKSDDLSSFIPTGATPGTPFKDLFEEVFTALKQTAAVADKLMQRKKDSVL